jgi:hypothetical protein
VAFQAEPGDTPVSVDSRLKDLSGLSCNHAGICFKFLLCEHCFLAVLFFIKHMVNHFLKILDTEFGR